MGLVALNRSYVCMYVNIWLLCRSRQLRRSALNLPTCSYNTPSCDRLSLSSPGPVWCSDISSYNTSNNSWRHSLNCVTLSKMQIYAMYISLQHRSWIIQWTRRTLGRAHTSARLTFPFSLLITIKQTPGKKNPVLWHGHTPTTTQS